MGLDNMSITDGQVITYGTGTACPVGFGRTLKEIQDVFSHEFGIRYVNKLRRERKLAAQSL